MTTADIVGIIIAVVLVAAFAAGAFRIMAGRRALRERFGPEYDNVVRETGSRAAAESELRRRTRAHKELALREIPEAERTRYRDMWMAAQARFVDDPAAAVRDADRIVAELIADRGYPVVDFPDRVSHLSVEHTRVLDDYRAGHELAVRNDAGRATTEELRQALVHYRAVYTDVLGDSESAPTALPDESGIAPVPGEGGDVNALAQSPLTGDSDEVAVYAPADPVPAGERVRAATAADHDADVLDAEVRDAEVRDAETRDAEVRDAEVRDAAEARDADVVDAEIADSEARDADAEARDIDRRDAEVVNGVPVDERADYRPDDAVVTAGSSKRSTKRRVNGARLDTTPTTEGTDATSDAR